MSEDTAHAPAGRLVSLDAFRGFTIASMILVNNPGSWSYVYPQLRHAEWNGWTFTDWIFPFFLWIVGVAMAFSFPRRMAQGSTRGNLVLHTVRRSAVLFLLGLIMAGFPFGFLFDHTFSFSTIRIPGVLQRIAVCYLFASMIFLYTSLRGQVIWTLALLIVYWLLIKLVPVPGYGAGVLEPMGNLAWYIDSNLLRGHTWSGAPVPGFDPEGIVSTIPAIATTLFGVLTGHWLRSNRTKVEKTAWMFVAGNACLLLGSIFDMWLPINKNLWTSSYSIFMTGWALICLATFYWLMEVKGYTKWAKPFVVYGMNAIAVFFLSGILARILMLIKVTAADGSAITLKNYLYQNIFQAVAGQMNGSLLFAISYVAFWWAIMAILYRMNIFIKI